MGIKKIFLDLREDFTLKGFIKEVIIVFLFYLMFLIPFFLILFFTVGYDEILENIVEIWLYGSFPLLLIVLLIWTKIGNKRKYNSFILLKMKLKVKEHLWLQITIISIISIIIIYYFVLYVMGYIIFRNPSWNIWVEIIPSVIFAPIIEETLFRGYIHNRFTEIYKDSYVEFSIHQNSLYNEKKIFRKKINLIKISYPVGITALIFTFSHYWIYILDFKDGFLRLFIFSLIVGFAREDWNSIVPPAIIHGFYNLYVNKYYFIIETQSFIDFIATISIKFDYYVGVYFHYPLDYFFIGVFLVAIIIKILSNLKKRKDLRRTQTI